MTRTERAKWYRKASHNDFKKKLDELNLVKAKVSGKIEKRSGALKEDAMTIRNLKREIAMLKTIAKERGLKL